MIAFTLFVCVLYFYRLVWVFSVGLLDMFDTLDNSLWYQSQLFVHKHLVIPAIDLVTASGLIYLFYAVSKNSQEILQKPFVLVKHRRKSFTTEELRDFLRGGDGGDTH